jgi:hypothetical protein
MRTPRSRWTTSDQRRSSMRSPTAAVAVERFRGSGENRHLLVVNNGDVLLSMTREWPSGLAVLSDPRFRGTVPDDVGQSGVAASRSFVAAVVQHGIDGPACAEVRTGQVDESLTCVDDGVFSTECDETPLADAADEEVATATLAPGSYQLRVFVDDTQFPELVVFQLGAP